MEDEENKELKEESVLLSEYKKLQENSVSKEKYEKDIQALKEKNNLYLKAITEGSKIETEETSDSKSLQDMINGLSKFKGTNLDYWKEMTATIDKVLKEEKEEEIIKITGSDGLEEIIKVNEGMKKMIEDSNGDADYFRNLYKARVQDSAPKISSEIERAGSLVDYLKTKK